MRKREKRKLTAELNPSRPRTAGIAREKVTNRVPGDRGQGAERERERERERQTDRQRQRQRDSPVHMHIHLIISQGSLGHLR